jgi:hypothetical protein
MDILDIFATFCFLLGNFMPYLYNMKEYECINCDYKTVRKNNFDKHLISKIHKNSKKTNNKKCLTENGKKKNIYNCLSCIKIFYNKRNYLSHLLNCKTTNGVFSQDNITNMVSATILIKNDENNCKNKQYIYNCELCNYVCNNKCNYNRHIKTKKHLIEVEKEKEKDTGIKNENKNKYKCFVCKFECSKKSNYNIHLLSNKHIQNTKEHEINKNAENTNMDNIKTMNIDSFKNEVISSLKSHLSFVLEENNKSIFAEQTKMMIESQTKLMDEQQNKMNKMITEIANKPTNITNNNNNQINNQQFNMNLFLNETCKDAMNISEFIENLQVSMEDMEKTGELGFAKGMSRIIMNNLNAIDVYKRPIHCSDAKRETLYVKNNGVWEKETEDRKKTKEVIYRISSLNVKQLLKWRDLPRNKGYEKSDHKKNDEFTKLVMEINKLREEEINKVITTVSKYVTIDKNKVKMSGYLN